MKKIFIKKSFILFMISIATLLFMTACAQRGTSDSELVSDKPFKGGMIVNSEYVLKHINDKNIILLDCRGEKEADKKTVKGAIVTYWRDLTTCSDRYGKEGDERWGRIPEPKDLSKRLGALGLDKNKEIICLGETLSGWGEDAKIAWELREAGYENVKIVDGGIDALYDAGVETQSGASKPVPCKVEVNSISNEHTIDTETLKKDYDKYVIIDTRTKEEYDGAIKYNEAKGGHLPGAELIEYTSLFRKDGTLISNADVEKKLKDKGISKDDNIAVYCTGGIRSAYMQMVLEMTGYKNTYNYNQSFWRWAATEKVEK